MSNDSRILQGALAILFLLLAVGMGISYLFYSGLKKDSLQKKPALPQWVENPEQYLKEYRQEQEELKKSYGVEAAKKRMLKKGFPVRP